MINSSNTEPRERLPLSFREKTAWVSLVVTLLVFVPYFTNVFRAFAGSAPGVGTLAGAFVGAVVLVVILLVVAQIAIALTSRNEPRDERDILIEHRSFRVAYNFLAVAMFGAIPVIIALSCVKRPSAAASYVALPFAAELFLLCFVAAEIVRYLTQIFCYRRGR